MFRKENYKPARNLEPKQIILNAKFASLARKMDRLDSSAWRAMNEKQKPLTLAEVSNIEPKRRQKNRKRAVFNHNPNIKWERANCTIFDNFSFENQWYIFSLFNLQYCCIFLDDSTFLNRLFSTEKNKKPHTKSFRFNRKHIKNQSLYS